jgi:hypothetical protein
MEIVKQSSIKRDKNIMKLEASPVRGFLILQGLPCLSNCKTHVECDSKMDIHYTLKSPAHLTADLVVG